MKTLEKAGVMKPMKKVLIISITQGTKLILNNIYINNRKNIVADIISVNYLIKNFNNNIYMNNFMMINI